ncbi:MAG: hypothetical protein C0404_01340 [Verrucomicrobia bacterium]|nr:hypothetical protein [Verrucomicrobiota bacterium]
MKTSLLTLATLSILATTGAIAQEKPAPAPQGSTVLDNGSFWRCHLTLRDPVFGKGADAKPQESAKKNLRYNSSLPPADWMKPEFDDGNWWRSPAPFYGGYGFQQPDNIGLIALRGKFAVEDPSRVKSLTFNMVYRGGAVIYVNGKEVKRVNLPEGPITMETLAENYPLEAYVIPEATAADTKPAKEKTADPKATTDLPAEDPEAAAKAAPKNEGPVTQKAIRWGWGDPGKYRDRCEMRIRRLENVVIPPGMLRKGMNVLAIEVHRSPFPPDFFTVGNWWDGFRCHAGVLSAQLKTDSPDVVGSNVERPKGFQVWNANPMMAIFDMDYGDPIELLNPIRIPGARNGQFSGQVVVSCDAAIKGLKAEATDLAGKDGKGKIPAANVQIRYAKPGGFEGGSDACYGTGEVSRFDPLHETEPGEVPVYTKQRGRKPYGAVQPIWVTVTVPADAAGGEYTGKLIIKAEGQKDTEVPVVMVVADWKLPDTKEYVTFVDMVESPESLAMYYEVPLWSDKHWALIEKTFFQLGRTGNKSVYIPLICKPHFGNSESMVRFVKQDGGTFKGDFAIMDKYLDVAEKHLGKPQVVCFNMWDNKSGGGYFNAKSDSSKWAKNLVSTVDPATGKVVDMETPNYGDPQAEACWKPICDELIEKMKKRGLENAMMIGICSDVRAAKEVVDLWKRLLPGAKWVIHSHGLESQIHGVPVGYSSTVWKVQYPKDPSIEHTYGWNKKPGTTIISQFQRDLVFSWNLTQNKLLPENNIGGGQRGFGRNGADFFPPYKNDKGQRTGMLANRYPASNWAQLSLKTCFLAPGPDGAIGTVRFEMTREGVQECEARIFIEKVLLDKAQRAKLGEEKAKNIQDMLDERIRSGLWGAGNYGWYVSSGWQERSERLYATAAEVARLLGNWNSSI